jgi:hypothetical protein
MTPETAATELSPTPPVERPPESVRTRAGMPLAQPADANSEALRLTLDPSAERSPSKVDKNRWPDAPLCGHCREAFTPVRKHQKFCRPSCRFAARWQRRGTGLAFDDEPSNDGIAGMFE